MIFFCVFFSLNRKLEGNKIPVAIVELRNIWRRFLIPYTYENMAYKWQQSSFTKAKFTFVSYRQSCVTCKFVSCLGISWHGRNEGCSENLGVGCSSLWHAYDFSKCFLFNQIPTGPFQGTLAVSVCILVYTNIFKIQTFNSISYSQLIMRTNSKIHLRIMKEKTIASFCWPQKRKSKRDNVES